MPDKRSNEHMDDLRERLYSRGEAPRRHERSQLTEEAGPAPVKSWQNPPQPPVPPRSEPTASPFPVPPEPKKKYRRILLLTAIVFFVLSIAASSLYIMLGRNTVGGNNINLSVTGPFTVGGGEVLSLQVGVTNHNSIPIESATLIVEYPAGTRSADDGQERELFTERIPLPSIAAGETYNLPLKARVFGEENQEATINTSIEYRVAGSNATFYKEADPLRFKIGHAPLVVTIDANSAISSGQEATIKLTIKSNSPLPLNNIVVRAEYPAGFDFSGSNPSPVSGRNVWNIEEIKPEESATLEITGVVTGTESEKRVLKFTVGVADERSRDTISSVLATAQTEFTIEQPFLTFDMTIDGSREDTVSLASNQEANVSINMENTSKSVVYDGVVEVKLSGNALGDSRVSVNGGYYDSNTRTVRFDSSSNKSLSRLEPGDEEHLSFSLRPQSEGLQTPQIVLELKATGRRVSESSAREEISGTIKRTVKVESKLDVTAVNLEAVSGPVPPKVGEKTTYRIGFTIDNGGNNIGGAIVSGTLPSYVTWENKTSGQGSWSYSNSGRSVEWKAGSVQSGKTATGSFEVSIEPSASQVSRSPVLVEDISLRADDSFTGSLLRDSASSISTAVKGENGSGTVKSN